LGEKKLKDEGKYRVRRKKKQFEEVVSGAPLIGGGGPRKRRGTAKNISKHLLKVNFKRLRAGGELRRNSYFTLCKGRKMEKKGDLRGKKSQSGEKGPDKKRG